jgi:hypothetical protein
VALSKGGAAPQDEGLVLATAGARPGTFVVRAYNTETSRALEMLCSSRDGCRSA